VTSNVARVLSHAEPRRLSRREYDRLAESGLFAGERVELIHGMVVQMSPMGPAHSDPVDLLTELLVIALAGRARVRIQQPFIAGDDSEPEPDIAIVPLERYATRHPDRAFLIIEVADSSLDHDRDTKSRLYAAAGVPEYWIVNIQEQCVEVHEAAAGGEYSRVRRVDVDASIAPAAFPDVHIRVADLLSETYQPP
jgi:Uma2 family endonuclease